MKAQIEKISQISQSNLDVNLKLEMIQTILNQALSSPSSPESPVKGKKPRKTVQAVKRDGRPLMKYITRELLSSCAGVTENEIVTTLLQFYPEKSIKVVTNTTKRRLKGEDMNLTENEEIVKEDDLYFIRQKVTEEVNS